MPPRIKLALIDAHALIHRAYHALPPMSTSAGVPTQAVYGFTAMLLKVLTTIKPTHVVAAFDVKGPTFRHHAFADYKAHRPAAADDLVVQFDLVRQLVQAFNIPIIEKQGFEADDIIGTLARGLPPTIKKIIVTGDMDALQLVNESTSVLTLKRGATDTVMYNPAAVRERFGFAPTLLPDYKGLRGDPSDNIPGVTGIGEKTAQTLVSQWGRLEEIYQHFDELSPGVRSKLEAGRTMAWQSRELATIRCDLELDFSLPAAQLSDYDVRAVEKLFVQLEFRSFLQRLPHSTRTTQPRTLFAKAAADAPTITMPDHYHLVVEEKEQEKLRATLSRQAIIAFDTETDRLGARQYPIVGMSFAARERGKLQAWYVPVTPVSVAAWRDLLENPRVGKAGHNLKYDYKVLRQSGIRLAPIVFDSMLASYVLHPDARQHNLDWLAAQELQHRTIPITDLIGQGKNQKNVSAVPLTDLATYAAEDAEVAWRLYEVFSPQIKEQGLGRVFTELELPLIAVLAEMELAGVKLDSMVLKTMGKKVQARLTALRKKIWRAAGEEFNVNSTQQLRRILYEKLLIPTERVTRTQTGHSTAAAELEKLRALHPIIALLEEYRELAKLHNTYIETLPKLVDKKTQRLYTSFNQAVAATGRLSSSDPNLQNIPARTELGQEIRAAFVAEAGYQLVKADYSQLELRLAAHISQDEKMLEAFRAGQDIHSATAAWVYGIPLTQVTARARREAKTLNFGVLYGMGAKKFAQTSGLSLEQARSFIERYKEQYRGITRLITETVAAAQQLGYVETAMGRRRYLPEINAQSPMLRAQAERMAFNFPIQGTAADILKQAMITLSAVIERQYPTVRMVLTVHDELVSEVPADIVAQFAPEMQRIMERVVTLDVPLLVDVAVGNNWRDTKLFAP
ncbi:MAG: DNA polymerase I [Candidatus Andersenbacteria bacterium]